MRRRNHNRFIRWILVLFLGWDLGYSFYGHYHMSIGGDIAQVVIPNRSVGYYDVLRDPLAIGVIRDHLTYSNPNRFFVHWPASIYLLYTPLVLQEFVDPITSIYFSIALFKTGMQAGIILLLVILLQLVFKTDLLNSLISAALFSSFFQTWGYNRFMGIIDQSVIYTFFYAFPMFLLLLYLLLLIWLVKIPVWSSIHFFLSFLMAILSVPLAMGGPLIPGIVLVAVLLLALWLIHLLYQKKYRIFSFFATSKFGIIAVLILWLSLLCLYSLYVGKSNALNTTAEVTLWDRYAKVPFGIVEIVTTKIGLPLLFAFLILNFILIRTSDDYLAKVHVYPLMKWLFAFILIYILLLPLGGYRAYRPYTVRYDTLLPVSLALFFIAAYTSRFVMTMLRGRSLIGYIFLLSLVVILYSFADRVKHEPYQCELQSLRMIASSSEDTVKLNNQCPVLEFRIVNDPEHSKLKGELLQRWRVTSKQKLFYQIQ